MNIGKRTNFVGFQIISDLTLDEGYWALPVVAAPSDAACDFCMEPAIYEVDAIFVLGSDGGNNVFYCQGCALGATTADYNDDTWISRDSERWMEMRALVNNPSNMDHRHPSL